MTMALQRFYLFYLIMAAMLLTACTTLPDPDAPAEPSDTEAAQLNFRLGIGYMQTQHFNLAIEKLQKALQYDSSLAEAENALGVLYEANKAAHLAEQHYQKALSIKPDYVLAKMNYARFLCANGQTAKGGALFLEAAVAPQQDAPEIAYTGAGVCARQAGLLPQAEQHFQQALQANAYAGAALFELALIKKNQSRYKEAREFLDSYHKRAGFSRASLELAIAIEDTLGNKAMRDQYTAMLRERFSARQTTVATQAQ